MSLDSITQSLIELVGIPGTSGHEEHVRAYLERRLADLGMATQVDAAGNLVAALPGEGRPLMLNAHMDRVPPGRGSWRCCVWCGSPSPSAARGNIHTSYPAACASA